MCEDCRLNVPGDAEDVQACDVLAAELMHEPVVDDDCLPLLLELRLRGLFRLLFELLPSFDVVAAVGVREPLVLLPLSTLC